MNAPTIPASGVYPLIKIPLNQLRPYKHQSRRTFAEEAMQSLTDSIKTQGVIQPIIVRSSPPGDDGTACIEPYEIVAGERRWRAAQRAGLVDIPSIVRDDLGDTDIEILHLIENLQREGLPLADECIATARLVELVGFDEACKQLGKDAPWVSRHSRYGELTEGVRSLIEDGLLTSVEMAFDIAALAKYSKKDYESAVDSYRSENAWDKPPTRASLRQTLKYAKENFDRKEEEKQAKVEQKAKLAADPKLRAEHDAERESAREAEEKERKKAAACARVKSEAAGAEKQFTHDLLQLLPADFSNVKSKYDLPISVECSTSFYYQRGTAWKYPATVDGCEFEIEFEGEIDTIAPALNAVSPGAKLDLELEGITQEQVRAIEKALGRKVIVRCSLRTSGKKITAAIASAQGAAKKDAAAAAGKPAAANHSVSDFIGLRCEKKKGAKVKAATFYEAYAAWLGEQGRTHEQLPLNSNEFGDAVAAMKIKKHRLSTGWHYLDIALQA